MRNLLLFEPPDAEDRRQALDITRSFIVEAPAGSGKTGLLIQRMLRLLASDAVTDPAQVLAITFTRKATHEMRDRILQQLAAARNGVPLTNDFDHETRPFAAAVLARDRELNWRLLEDPSRLNISTIDALSIQIANSLPVLSGAGGQSPVEDSAELYREAARRTLSLLGGADQTLDAALETLLLHRDGNLADCEFLIAEMLGWRDQWGNLIPFTGEQLTDDYLETITLPRLEKALEPAICRTLTQLDQVLPAALGHELALLSRRMSHAQGYNGAGSPIALCHELHQAPGLAAADLEHWRALTRLLITTSEKDWRKLQGLQPRFIGFDISSEDKARLAALIDDLKDTPGLLEALRTVMNLPPLRYPREQWLVAKALFRILSRALIELQIVFADRGECDFTQFALIARDALSREGTLDDFAASSGFNLDHLLVDEMQDTSSSQYDLLRLLTQHWDGHSQTVFLVGDPKQSIYLFRQARVARFVETLNAKRLGELPLTPLYLSANFRSQASLVASFNETFSTIFSTMTDATDSESVLYRNAQARRGRTFEAAFKWHPATIPYADDHAVRAESRRDQALKNAASIRRLVEDWRARPLPADRQPTKDNPNGKPWQIAVLVRNRRHLQPIVNAFKEAGPSGPIPFRAINTELLSERQEVLDLVALTRALLHPADRTAWLALLRTPWCGLTLRDLHLLAGQDDSNWREHTILSLINQRGHELSADGVSRLEPFWTVMSSALSQRGRMSLSEWVDRTWRAFGGAAFATADELANIERFFELLDQLEARNGALSIASLEHAVTRLYAAESTEPGAVDLLTIHSAKGLEWDFVIVPQLEGSAQSTRRRLLSWLEIEPGSEVSVDPEAPRIAHGILAPVQRKGSAANVLNIWINSVHTAREEAERKRLFYVACTRAREELHLFAAPDRKKDGEIIPRPDSLLKAAWPAAKPEFDLAPAIQPQPVVVEKIAAAEGISLVPAFAAKPVNIIERIPLEAFAASKPLAAGTASKTWTPFDRPEGSFEARAFGNAMHDLLELLGRRIANHRSPAELLTELPSWTPRIATLLRAHGLAPEAVPRAATNILRSLTRTLEDPDGLWILAPHPEAASELGLTSAAKILGSSSSSQTIRLDRSFLAAETPRNEGLSHLWIVDFKTGTHGADGLDAFLTREREKYAPQLEAYARSLAARGLPIRLALYYPTIPKLVWWPFEPQP